MSLKEPLSSITKGTSNVNEYLRSLHVIDDELALIGHPIDDLDLVIISLNGLGPSLCEFTATICTRDIPLMFDELFDKLIDFEIFMQRDDHQQQSFPATANYTTHSQSAFRRKKKNNSHPSNSSS
uniref:Retrovirus-related Pol polyprotein from transposon TNT 1-94 n=1 Tax=Cajanus cajan TaxID=3821 RepID=A0A151RNB7_CAJCA|nr:hypothetical protein KK1_034478 [Cajanus cajan]